MKGSIKKDTDKIFLIFIRGKAGKIGIKSSKCLFSKKTGGEAITLAGKENIQKG